MAERINDEKEQKTRTILESIERADEIEQGGVAKPEDDGVHLVLQGCLALAC